MLLKHKEYFMLLCLLLLGCTNNSNKNISVEICNTTDNIILFDKPSTINIANDIKQQNVFYLNKNINILKRKEQIDLKYGMKTVYHSLPKIELIKLQPGEKIEVELKVNPECQLPRRFDYIFFVIKDSEIEKIVDYYDYIYEMKISGFYISNNFSSKLDIKESDLKKITPLAEEDFPALYNLYNQE